MFLDDEVESSVSRTVFTISEITAQIKDLLEMELGFIAVRGEITNFRPASSGHLYFSLKDQECVLAAVLFRNALARVRGLRLENGVEVICRGRLSVYGPRGSYQIIVEQIEAVGAGSLQAQFEALKKKLELEGLFRSERKREIPRLPRRIAVITSPTGAALRDVISVLSRRHAGVPLIIVPALVQGAGAEAELVRAMVQANDPRLGADVILLTRGGGSLEDLWCFNSELLARAIYGSRLPVVSAVGHEIDFTIADFVADLRAPTPSAAAELLVQEQSVLLELVVEHRERLTRALRQRLESLALLLDSLTGRLKNPKDRIIDLRLRFDEWQDRLVQAMRSRLSDVEVQGLAARLAPALERVLQRDRRFVQEISQALPRAMQQRLQTLREQAGALRVSLEALSPLAVLERGYSLVYLDSGILLKDPKQASAGASLQIRTARGEVGAEVRKDWQQ